MDTQDSVDTADRGGSADDGGADIAIIGMAGRFPGAADTGAFWPLLRDGAEAVTFFSEQELLDEGVPEQVVKDPRYVRAKGYLPGADLFDAGFFGFSPRDAATLDPQQRIFLECAWEALEDAGVDPDRAPATGLYAGSSTGTYLGRPLRELSYLPDFMEVVLGNDKDMLPTRTAYKLGLTGPAICVQSACSTALVAVHLACQGLLSGDCDIALAGGVSVMVPLREGYLHQEEGIYARDGRCMPFDARATGTVPGDGVGVVVLKMLGDALADGDTVRAVVKGSAVNNDGAAKVGYTAPSVAGQAAVIRAAHRAAGVRPGGIGYVETHGTATVLGDPIEVTALSRAFRDGGAEGTGTCAIGSVKAAIGHLDVAAGIAGLIKTVLALEHRTLPPSPYFRTPNPKAELASSPFHVPARALPWPAGAGPRRAGVSSFGIGGTNAHVVVEEAPAAPASPPPAPGPQLLLVSARTRRAADEAALRLADRLAEDGGPSLADAAYTTQLGRKAFEHRRFVVAADAAEAVAALRTPAGPATGSPAPATAPPVVLLLPGQGAQHPAMAAELYAAHGVFRAEYDRCRGFLDGEAAAVLERLTRPGAPPGILDGTQHAQPALFAVEYALARQWQEWGVRPAGLLGHSLGEYVAACLAGVFRLGDAVALVAARGALMGRAAPGAMLGVQLGEDELGELPAGVSLAAVNAADQCTVAGAPDAVEAYRRSLAAREVGCRLLHTTRAFHSPAMEEAAHRLREVVAGLAPRAPEVPFVSDVTGDWITAEQATDPGYWAEHTLRPVRFAAGLATVTADGSRPVLLEVGPGQGLTALARRVRPGGAAAVASTARPGSGRGDTAALEHAAGALWAAGVAVDWRRRTSGRGRRKVPLPAYPFQRQRYWREDIAGPAAYPDAAAAGAVPYDGTTAGPGNVEAAAAAETDLFSGPQADVRRAVAEIWQELLGVEPGGITGDFFELGGHSLLGTRLVNRLRDRFGVECRLRELFAEPTVAGQAELVATLRALGRRPAERPQDNEEGAL
ncbi:type I polyketide synthase [Streptomyces sp. NPDC021020]|uniref:type I polyketide synthase n=1 Tax=Streptomyces sp. NPDC021020 TaxID=3365109 RepID=UPI0037B4266C